MSSNELRARWDAMGEDERSAYWSSFEVFCRQYGSEVGNKPEVDERLRARWESMSADERAEHFNDFGQFAWKQSGGLEAAERGTVR